MSEQQTSYRHIVKATSIFGGVQVFQILIQIVRSKFIAILLGPSGMGIMGLLVSTTSFISQLTKFGLGTSAVKNIASAYSTGNEARISTIIIVLRRLVWITGTIGTLLAMVLSPWLSKLTFGNSDYTIAYIWISVILLFNQLCNGQLALLQGLRKLQYLAKANIFGSLLGLVITVPLYYKLGINGIVPGIIIASIISLFFSWYYSRKVKIQKVRVSKIRTIAEGKEMLILGFAISMSDLAALGIAYLVRVFISHFGGFEQVGLYSAGFAIINSYTGLIFIAMGTDYYPRLSAVSKSDKLSNQAINQQAEISLLILAPILIVFMVFIQWLVILLYSSQFIAVKAMIYWAVLGIFFKTVSWAIAYVFLAKGESKVFFWNELIYNLYTLGLNLLGYYYFGLTGLGVSFLVSYLLYFIQVYLIANKRFEFGFSHSLIKLFVVQFLLAITSFIIIKYIASPYSYMLGCLIISISLWYSYVQLDKRIAMREIASKFLNKIKIR